MCLCLKTDTKKYQGSLRGFRVVVGKLHDKVDFFAIVESRPCGSETDRSSAVAAPCRRWCSWWPWRGSWQRQLPLAALMTGSSAYFLQDCVHAGGRRTWSWKSYGKRSPQSFAFNFQRRQEEAFRDAFARVYTLFLQTLATSVVPVSTYAETNKRQP